MKNLDFCPTSASRTIVSKMATTMLMAARAKEAGILQGNDIEELHQYRVCLRKTRSLISLLKEIYPVDTQQELKKQLGELTRSTNELRDLDVFLEGWDSYLKLIPKHINMGLMGLFEDLENQQIQAKLNVNLWLASQKYGYQINSLLRFFSDPNKPEKTASSHKPIKVLVSKKIRKRYQKICQMGLSIQPTTPDKEIHAVRIECKKLRYLLEFFGSMFNHKAHKTILKTLKKLQDHLGHFNDYSVQQTLLKNYLETNAEQKELVAPISALLDAFRKHQQQARSELLTSLTTFADQKTEKQIYQLLQ